MSGTQQTPKARPTATNAGKKPDVSSYYVRHKAYNLTTSSIGRGRTGIPRASPDPLPGHSSSGVSPPVNDTPLMHDLCLDWTKEQAAEFEAPIPVYRLEALDVADVYPPKEVWAFEKPTVVHDVEVYLKMKALAGHKTVKPVHVLDTDSFKIIGPKGNAVLHAEKGHRRRGRLGLSSQSHS